MLNEWNLPPGAMYESALAALVTLSTVDKLTDQDLVRTSVVLAHQVFPLITAGRLRMGSLTGSGALTGPESRASTRAAEILSDWDDLGETAEAFAGRLDAKLIAELRIIAPTWAQAVWNKMLPLTAAQKTDTRARLATRH
jgi:hypothetical protein